jgi:hypothetical protein
MKKENEMDFLKLNKLVPVPHNFPYFYRLFGYEMAMNLGRG